MGFTGHGTVRSSSSGASAGLQFFRMFSKSKVLKSPRGVASRETEKPSGLTTGTTMLRVAFTRRVVRAFRP
jgi:hypothetical protein